MVVLGRSALGDGNRASRRLEGLGVLLSRAAAAGRPGVDAPHVVHAAQVLTGFAFVDEFAADADPREVAPRVVALVKRAANLD